MKEFQYLETKVEPEPKVESQRNTNMVKPCEMSIC